ncbi:MAG: DUF1289 domain-containing protein [Methylococcaceae bacterium]|nr:DUF1289 domain-containing protein [Methylococcaceae bacterium]
MTRNHHSISSPCIRNCCLDNNDICLGCFRSLHEITNWTNADEKTRKQYLANANQRRQNHLASLKLSRSSNFSS